MPKEKGGSKCDPSVANIKAECDELKGSNLQKTYLQNELAQVKEKQLAISVVYVHFQELAMAIPQAFQAVADGKMLEPQLVS